MSDLMIKPVVSNREKKQFLNLPWKLYKNDPNWIPPLRDNQKELVGYTYNPFYDDAEVQTFLAFRDGELCGRVAAIVNHVHNRLYKEQRGFFGFFESTDDQEVANGLFDAARDWLAERDIHAIRGPMNPSMNYECGLLIEGFDSPPTFMMTYNHSYYEQLIENWGFKKTQDMYEFWGHVDMLDSLDKKLDFVVKEATRRFNIKLRRFKTSDFKTDVRIFLDIYNKSLVGTWGFTPLSEKEIDHLGTSLKHLIVPEMTTIAEIEGRPVGAMFGMLDYNPRIKKIDGRLYPFGFLRLLWNRRAIKKVRLVSTNVLPEFQRWGVGLVVLSRIKPEVLEWGIEEAEFSWVLESNHLSYSTLKRGGAKIRKTFRIYDFEPETDIELETSSAQKEDRQK